MRRKPKFPHDNREKEMKSMMRILTPPAGTPLLRKERGRGEVISRRLGKL
jgi:hypothetical protein